MTERALIASSARGGLAMTVDYLFLVDIEVIKKEDNF
jgi:hypothetical protein